MYSCRTLSMPYPTYATWQVPAAMLKPAAAGFTIRSSVLFNRTGAHRRFGTSFNMVGCSMPFVACRRRIPTQKLQMMPSDRRSVKRTSSR